MRNKKYHTVETVPKSNRHIVETETKSIPLMHTCKLQKGCTRLAAASDKVYQLLFHGRWFSPGTPASSTTKTGRHDLAEILLKVALHTNNQSILIHTYITAHFPGLVHALQEKVAGLKKEYIYKKKRNEIFTIINFRFSVISLAHSDDFGSIGFTRGLPIVLCL